MNTVRTMCKGFGERLQKCSVESFTAKRVEEIPEILRGAVAPLLESIDHLNEQIRYYDQMEAHIARERYPKHRLLDQVNGVGVHTALSFMLTIGDPERFPKSRGGGEFSGDAPRGNRIPGRADRNWALPRRGMSICARRWSTARTTFWDRMAGTAIYGVTDCGSAGVGGRTPRSGR